jgi:hypothetical protein
MAGALSVAEETPSRLPPAARLWMNPCYAGGENG